jgi:hypothetical protein
MDVGCIAEVDETTWLRSRHRARRLSIEVKLGRSATGAKRYLDGMLARHEPNGVGEDSQVCVVGAFRSRNADRSQNNQYRSTRHPAHFTPPKP